MEIFDWDEFARLHAAADEQCSACWQGYPLPCDCGGLIHAEPADFFGAVGGAALACDSCGEDYTPA